MLLNSKFFQIQYFRFDLEGEGDSTTQEEPKKEPKKKLPKELIKEAVKTINENSKKDPTSALKAYQEAVANSYKAKKKEDTESPSVLAAAIKEFNENTGESTPKIGFPGQDLLSNKDQKDEAKSTIGKRKNQLGKQIGKAATAFSEALRGGYSGKPGDSPNEKKATELYGNLAKLATGDKA